MMKYYVCIYCVLLQNQKRVIAWTTFLLYQILRHDHVYEVTRFSRGRKESVALKPNLILKSHAFVFVCITTVSFFIKGRQDYDDGAAAV
jgi:hypothetical protein